MYDTMKNISYCTAATAMILCIIGAIGMKVAVFHTKPDGLCMYSCKGYIFWITFVFLICGNVYQVGEVKKILKRNKNNRDNDHHPWQGAWAEWDDDYYYDSSSSSDSYWSDSYYGDEYYYENYYWDDTYVNDEGFILQNPTFSHQDYDTPRGLDDSNRRLRGGHGGHGNRDGDHDGHGGHDNKKKETCCGPRCVGAFGIIMTIIFIVHQCFLRKYRQSLYAYK